MDPPWGIGPLQRILASPTNVLEKVSPQSQELIRRVATAHENIVRDQERELGDTHNAFAKIKDSEWGLVAEAISGKRPVTGKMEEARVLIQDQLARLREQLITAKRQYLIDSLKKSEADAKKIVPDNWGIDNYYPHSFPGNWQILERVGFDEKGAPVWEPVPEVGWRQITDLDAMEAAAKYKEANPSAVLKVGLDKISGLPGNRTALKLTQLKALSDKFKELTQLEGEEFDAALEDFNANLRRVSFAKPKVAERRFAHALRREANLSGWAKDKETYEQYIIGAVRYIELLNSRPKVMALRNALAEQGKANAAEFTILDLRKNRANSMLMGMVDESISALEGYPRNFEGELLDWMERKGRDPRLFQKTVRTAMEVEALAKLGWSPAAAIINLTQVPVMAYPKLGGRFTDVGYKGFVKNFWMEAVGDKGEYQWLLDELGIKSQSTKLDTDSIHAYLDYYFPQELRSLPKTPQEAAAMTGKAVKGGWNFVKLGLLPFQGAEYSNRGVTAIGAFEKHLAEGHTRVEAIEQARVMTRKTNFVYAEYDRPLALRMLPAPVAQFKTFAFKATEYMLGLQGAEIVRFLAAVTAVGGVFALPFVNTLDEWYKYFSGISLLDEARTSKSPITRAATRGVPGAVLGIDLSKGVSFTDTFSMKPSNIVGPLVGDLYRGALAFFTPADTMESAKAKADFLRGISPLTNKYFQLDPRRRAVIDPVTKNTIVDKLSDKEMLIFRMGMVPLRVADENARNYVEDRRQLDYQSRRSFIVTQLAFIENLQESGRKLSADERAGLSTEYNHLQLEAAKRGLDSNLEESVRQRKKEMLMNRAERDLLHTPKPLREGMENINDRFRSPMP